MASQYINGLGSFLASSACMLDVTAPTFAGVSSLIPQSDGSLLASWTAATDATPPIYYEVFIKQGSATGLFSTTPLATRDTSLKIYYVPGGSVLQKDSTYYVGVRARDSAGNIETNTVSLSAVSSGVIDGASYYEAHGTFSLSPAYFLQGTLWGTLQEVQKTTGLGTASYTVYNKSGVAVSGLTQSGIVADGNGFFIITAVDANGKLVAGEHYTVKISIVMDSETKTSITALQVLE